MAPPSATRRKRKTSAGARGAPGALRLLAGLSLVAAAASAAAAARPTPVRGARTNDPAADGREGGRRRREQRRRRRPRGGGGEGGRTARNREQERLRRLHRQALQSRERRAPPLRLHEEDRRPSRHHRQHQQLAPQRRLQQLCSCAPTSFSITLDLLNSCLDDTLESQPGIADADCTIEVGDPDADGMALTDGVLAGTLEEVLAGVLDETSNETAATTVGDGNGDGISVEVIVNGTSSELNSHGLGLTSTLPLLGKTSVSVKEMIAGIPWLNGDEAEDGEAENEDVVEAVGEEDGANEEGEPAGAEGRPDKKQKKQQKKQGILPEEQSEPKVTKKKQNRDRARGQNRRNGPTDASNNEGGSNPNDAGDAEDGPARRRLQSPNVPVEINSITLIELNSAGDVLNVDDRFTNVAFPTGTTFELDSISRLLAPGVPIEDQLDFVPETTVLFYIGRNAAGFGGEEVRGRFVWRYTNGCGPNDRTIEAGNELAWNAWTSVEEQTAEFCPANGEGPAPTPRPTPAPTPGVAPATDPPTDIPTFSPSAPPTSENGPGPTPSPTFELASELPTFDAPPTDPPAPVPTSPIPTEEPTEAPTRGAATPRPTRGNGMSMSMPRPSYGRPTGGLGNLLDYFGSGSRSGKGSKRHGKAGKTSKSRKAGKRSKGSGSGGSSREHWSFLSGKSSKSAKSSKSSKSSKKSSSSSSGSSSEYSRSRRRRQR